MTATALFGGLVQGTLVDRPRIAAAYPLAKAQGQLPKWGAELATAWATNDIVPITGGTVKLGSRVLTTQAWKRSYQLSVGMGAAFLAVSMLYGIPNLVDGLRDEGSDGLLGTRAGRTGVAGLAGGVLSAGILGVAYMGATRGRGRLAAALAAPIHSRTSIVLAKTALGVPVMVNEMGYLDFMDRGERRDAWQAAGDTTRDLVRQVPVVGRSWAP